MKRFVIPLLCLLFLLMTAAVCSAASPSPLLIKGLVKTPLTLTMKDLEAYPHITVQLNELTKSRRFQGVFYYQGFPLRTLLDRAEIQKPGEGFQKNIDLAVSVRNREGRQVVLSWGELYYRNPGNILVAISAQPIMPHSDCKSCHSPEFYNVWLNPLSRQIGFPKLVVASDTWSDRSIENITEIEVLGVKPGMPSQKKEVLYSHEFQIQGPGVQSTTIRDLLSFSRQETRIKQIGEGKGYHGVLNISGASFERVLGEFIPTADLNSVFLVSAPDGYRSLLSYGEVFLASGGERVTIVDAVNNEPPEQDGRFIMILPDDLMADRWVKAVELIEWIPLTRK